MTDDDSTEIETQIKIASEGLGTVGSIIKLVENNPDAKQAAANLAITAKTITQTINNCLLPLAAVNYAFDKAKNYFQENFAKDLSEKTQSISPEDIITPKPSVVGPALQGLAFSCNEQELRDMYLCLIATAMNRTLERQAHPAFVEIIKQMTAEEAKLLQRLLIMNQGIPIVEIRKQVVGEIGWHVITTHLLNVIDSETKEIKEDPIMPALVDNWCRLQLMTVSYDKALADKQCYEWVDNRPEYKAVMKTKKDMEMIIVVHGVLEATSFGVQFAKTVGILN